MEKIFKKSLAIMVSAAICLTALIGCLTVSAERGEGTITVGTVEGKAGDSVTVPVELEYTSSQENGLGIAAALFDVKFDTNVLTITKIEREDPTNDAIAYTVQWRTTDGDESSIDVRDGAVRILAVGKDETAVVPSMSLNLTFTINSEAPAGASYITFEILLACDYGTADIDGIYANDEDMISMSANNGSVTVAEDQTEPVLDSSIDLSASYANISSEINLAIVLDTNSVSNYTRYELEITRNTFTNNYMYQKQVDVMSEPSAAYGSREYYLYTGIGMYEMNVPITVVVKCYDAEDNYIAYNEVEFNIVDMLKDIYYTERTQETTKNMIVDLLYLGTEAQEYFGAEGSDLSNVALPTADFDVESTTEFIVEELANVETITPSDDYPSATSSLNLNIAKNPGTYYIISGLSSLERNSVNITTTYTNGLNSTDVTETVNGEDATYIGNRYYYVFNKIAFYDLDKTVTMTVTYNDETVLTTEFTVETYIAKNYTNESQGALLIALAKFSKSARINFIG